MGAHELSTKRKGRYELVHRRRFDAPRAELFAALTEPARLRQWLRAGGRALATCEADVRTGGSYRYVFRGGEGPELEMRGDYREVVPNERIVHTEAYTDVDWEPLVVTTELADAPGGTLLTVTTWHPTEEARDENAEFLARDAHEVYGRLERCLARRT